MRFTILLFYSIVLVHTVSSQERNIKLNAPSIGIGINRPFFAGNNHHSRDLNPKFGFIIEGRVPIYKGLGVAVNYSRARTDLRDESLLYFNSKRVAEQYRGFSLGYSFDFFLDILEPRLHFTQQITKYPNDFRTTQNLYGVGLKYGHYLMKGIYATIHLDYYKNLSNKIDAPDDLRTYMNSLHATHLGFSVLYRLWHNE